MGAWSKGFDGFKARARAGRVKMIVSLCPPYAVSEADRKAKNGDGSPSASCKDNALSQFIVTQILRAKYPATPEEQARGIFVGKIKDKDAKKIVGKLQNLLQRAINDDAEEITLDQTQAEWLRDAVEAWDVSSDWSGWRLTLLEHLDETIKDALAAEKSAKESAKAPANGAEKSVPEPAKA